MTCILFVRLMPFPLRYDTTFGMLLALRPLSGRQGFHTGKDDEGYHKGSHNRQDGIDLLVGAGYNGLLTLENIKQELKSLLGHQGVI